MKQGWAYCFWLVGLLAAESAQAHSFGQVYNLPVPFWLYAWGATAALVASFLISAYFLTGGKAQTSSIQQGIDCPRIAFWIKRLYLLAGLRWAAVLALVLCIVTGLWGTRSLYGNFNMTFFWIVFLLGFAYLTAIVGNWYALINPWRLLSDCIGRFWPGYLQGRRTYPDRLGSWPALAVYAGFIWLELLG
ncbi:MAG: hypothetical protein R3352_04610, partial [Salinisphaeraceae bacterium]|nr:hypothetical protein [Salinisphaeraceae bacterium]